MMKHILSSLLILLLCNSVFAQTSLRGMYIDHFSVILGNQAKEDSLLHYAQDSSYNYLALYDLQALNLNNSNTANSLASFIKRARENFGIQYLGAVGETYSSFSNSIVPYNSNRSDDHERFNVFNLEFEFWTTSSVSPGGYYCTQYLQQANCSCDTSGGFKFFIRQMHSIDSIAAVQQVISETYLGWFNEGQASQIQHNVDRVLLHAYRTGTSSLFGYSKTRLQYLASNNSTVDVAPIFSSEPSFMGPWIANHAQIEAYNQYKSDYDNDNSSWKQYINVLGYQWFDWKYMPKPVPGSFNPVITASGPTTFCTGGNVTLTASAGDSYVWSTGATTRTINVNTTGSYSCDIFYNNNTYSTTATSVSVKNYPTASITPGNQLNGQMPLSATATAGSGSVISYQWKLNNNIINGASDKNFISVVSGDYTVKVINTYGCEITSDVQNVSINGSTCVASTPTGLISTALTETSRTLAWDQGQTGDSIIVKYKPDLPNGDYHYVRMINVGQCQAQISGLEPATTYVWNINTTCENDQGDFSVNGYFTTGGVNTGLSEIHIKNSDQGSEDASTLKVYPNPALDKIQIEYESTVNSPGELIVYDIRSSVVFSKKVQVTLGINKFIINSTEYKNGLYFISLKNNQTVLMQRIMVGH